MNFLPILLKSVTFEGEEAANAVTEAANAAANTAAAQAGSGAGSMLIMIVYIVVIFALMYIFAIMPQKKREKELKEMQNAVKVGDWVMTSSGFYGKVTDIYDQNVVVEFGLNKGIRIPVVKSEIYGNTEPNLTNKPQPEESKK